MINECVCACTHHCIGVFMIAHKEHFFICGFMHRYYVLAPLSLFPRAEEFLVKTSRGLKSCRREEFHISMEAWKPFLEIGWLYWLGGAMFIWGWIHQSRCHMILVSFKEYEKSSCPYFKGQYHGFEILMPGFLKIKK